MADGTVKIDLLFPANQQEFHSDTELVNDLLKRIGEGTGQHMDDEFDKNTKKMADQSKSTSKQIKDDFKDPVKQKIEGDDKDLNSKVKSSKLKLKDFPKETKTKLIAEAQKAGIDNFGKLLKHLPKKQQTELLAKAEKDEVINFDELIKKVPKKYQTEMKLNDNASPGLKNIQSEAQVTSDKFSHLKEIIAGSFIGNALSGAFSAVTSGLQSLASEAIQSSDAIFKFKSTMKFGGFGQDEIKSATKEVKKYADDTVYELNDVSNTTAQLAANGIKDYMGLTEAAGNLNAAAGGNADTFKSVAMMLTQTAGAGKLTTENWNQLTDAIPGASGKLQEAMKKNKAFTGNFRDAMADGQVTADEFSKAIMQLGQEDGAVKAAKSTQTFEGAIGNMQAEVVSDMDKVIDAFGKKKLTDAIGQVGKLASSSFGLILKAISWFEGKDVILGAIWSHLKDIAKIFGGEIWSTISDIFGDIAKAFGVVKDKSDALKDPLATIDNFLIMLGEHKDAIKKTADALMILFAVKKARDFGKALGGVVGSIGSLGKALGGVVGSIGSLGKRMIIKPGLDGSGAEKELTLLGKGLKGIGTGIGKSLKWTAKIAWSGAKKSVSLLWSGIKGTGKLIGNGLKWTAKIAVKGAQLAMKGLVKTAQITGKGISAAFNLLKANPLILIASAIAAVVVALVELYKHNKKFRKFVNGLIDSAKDAWNGTVKWFKKLGKSIAKIFDSVVYFFKKNWKDIGLLIVNPVAEAFNLLYKHNKKFRNFTNGLVKSAKNMASNVGKWFGNMKDKAVRHASNLWNSTKKHFSDGWNNVKKLSSKGKDSIISHFNNMKKRATSYAKSMWDTAKKDFKNGAKTSQAITKTMKDVVSGHWGNLGKDISRIGSSIKKTAHDHFSGMYDSLNKLTGGGLSKLTSAFSGFGKGVKNIFSDIKKSIENHVKNGINGAIGFLNGGIGGINSVIHTFGGSKNAIGKIKKLASGGSGYRGIAMVNDGGGEEAIIKGGHAYKVTGKNAYVSLEGDETIMPHGPSRAMFGSSIAHYAKGSDNWFSSLTGWFKDKWDGIVSFIKHPIKSLENITSKAMGKVSGSELVTKVTPALNTGFVRGIWKKFKDMLSDLKTAHDDEGGSFDGKMGAHGVYGYLWKIASQAMKKFGMKFTSGYRPGDAYYHGKHQAIDIAFDASKNGSKSYFAPANWVFDHFKKQIGYVITQGQIKTRGKFNHLGSNPNGWSTWMDHDHYDHLHLNGMWGPGDIGSSGGGGKVTGSHSNWLKQAGFRAAEIAAANWIVSRESGWNPKATNSGSGAYGLPQSLPGSKMASAGSDWRTNPLTQLKWMKSYIRERYGTANAAKSFWQSHNWYENGGFADKPSIFGEKGLEAAVPLSAEKADQGYAMLGKSAAYMAQRDSLRGDSTQSTGGLEQELSKANSLLNKINKTIDLVGEGNIKATYATAFNQKMMYVRQAHDQRMADSQRIGDV